MSRTVEVFGVPMDLGADRRGVDMGPSAIRYAGITDELADAGVDCVDGGDLPVPRPEESDPNTVELGAGRAKFLTETETVCRRVEDAVAASIDDGHVPLVLGGDHSIAIGTVAGAGRDTDLGIVWFDAHGDFNTPETTPSGNVHGMSLAAILGDGYFADASWARTPTVDPENVALVGTRDLDEGEKRRLRESDVSTFTISDVDDRGVTDVVDDALAVASEGTDRVHVSLDLDWLDPSEAPGVGTPVRGGVTYREAHVAMEHVAAHRDRFSSFELVEVNPILDQHNRTAELACELVSSAFGQYIL